MCRTSSRTRCTTRRSAGSTGANCTGWRPATSRRKPTEGRTGDEGGDRTGRRGGAVRVRGRAGRSEAHGGQLGRPRCRPRAGRSARQADVGDAWRDSVGSPGEGVAMKTLLIWTDGSCMRNPGGPGGWAYRIKRADGSIVEASGSEEATTNNRMEVM